MPLMRKQEMVCLHDRKLTSFSIWIKQYCPYSESLHHSVGTPVARSFWEGAWSGENEVRDQTSEASAELSIFRFEFIRIHFVSIPSEGKNLYLVDRKLVWIFVSQFRSQPPFSWYVEISMLWNLIVYNAPDNITKWIVIQVDKKIPERLHWIKSDKSLLRKRIILQN
jgi:hypothetical protein